MLTKNSFLEEINKQYVLTARAKGLTERAVLYGHVFRNAMLMVIAGFPAAFVSVLFTGSLLIEVIFSLDGLGLLGFEAAINRDYPVMFGTLYVFTLLGLVLKICLRPPLRPGRSAHRLRGAGPPEPWQWSSHRLVPTASERRASPIAARRLANFKANRRGYVFAMAVPRSVRRLAVRRADRQRPTAAGALRGPALLSRSSSPTRRPTSAASSRPRPTTAIPAVRELIEAKGWIVWPPIPYSYDTVVRDLPTPAPSPPTAPELAGHRRPGPRRAGAGHLRLSHLGAVRPDADAAQLGGRHRRRCGAGLLRRLGRPGDAALHGDLGRLADALSADHHVELRRAELLDAARS